MKKILLIIFLISQLSYANDNIEISILTCSVGQEVYSVFGHTAIRIVDQENKIDKVYNFGMFDFASPNFEYKYLKGQLKYHRGIQETKDFIEIYTYENRLITEQSLQLTTNEKNKLLNRLQFLNRPENKYYYYSFLKKNCSTETRDLLSYIGVNFENQKLEKSNRDLINSYLQQMPWLKLGINLVLGKSLDRNSTRNQSMFLPDYLQKEIGLADLNDKNLVKSEKTLNLIESKSQSNIWRIFSPILVFSLLAFIFLFWFPKPLKIITSFSFGITGVFILTMWLFSGHEEVKSNLNIIWCNPLYILYIPLLIKNKTNKTLSLILVASLIISIFVWLFKVQIFDISILPILAILGILNLQEFKKMKDRTETTTGNNV